jgi:hypothetical protein
MAEGSSVEKILFPKYIPSHMKEGIRIAMDACAVDGGLTDEIRIKYFDRYVIDPHYKRFVFLNFQYIIEWIQKYSWEECYKAQMSEEKCNTQVERTKAFLISNGMMTEKYIDSMMDDLYYSGRYKPSLAHGKRLLWLSEKTNTPFIEIIGRDMDIRVRRDRFLSPDHSIRTSFGADYLYLLYFDNEANEHKGCLVNVGRVCIICLKENNLVYCGRCKEATYCSKKHQTEDWGRHKKECNIS